MAEIFFEKPIPLSPQGQKLIDEYKPTLKKDIDIIFLNIENACVHCTMFSEKFTINTSKM